MRWLRDDGYVIDDSAEAVDRAALLRLLTSPDAYWWAAGIDATVFDRAITNSLTFSIITADTDFVGFGRVVTDHATFGYIADVIIDARHRGRGLGTWLVRVAVDHPDLSTCRRLMLATQDAHGLYAGAGFVALAHPDRWMERHDPLRSAPPATVATRSG